MEPDEDNRNFAGGRVPFLEAEAEFYSFEDIKKDYEGSLRNP